MLPGVRVISGPARCGKTQRLLGEYRQALAHGPLGGSLWLSPTHRGATSIREQLLDDSLRAAFSPNCLTFDQFARQVLEASPQPMRLIGPVQQRQILRALVDRACDEGRLTHFAPIAGTRGFLDLLVRFIQELKRIEVWPQELADACGQFATQKDQELCDLYARYQQILNDHDLYDAEGRFWSARALLRDGIGRPFESLRYVFVDGFTDFTRTEHEILEILSSRVETLCVSLPLELDSPRRDLFAKPGRTLDELRRRHPRLELESLVPATIRWPALAHLERNLFANPRQLTPSKDGDGIEIVAAADATGEIEEIARRIKKLLVHGDSERGSCPVRPGEIVVVFRSLAEPAELVREVFAQFGIPASIASGQTLQSSGALTALVAWLRLDVEDWPFRQVLSLLMQNAFCPTSWPEWHQGRAAAAAERLVRHLQIPVGRQELITQVERLAARDAAPTSSESHQAQADDSLADQARIAYPLLARMAATLDALPTRAPLAEWADAIGQLAASTSALSTGALPTDAALGDRDRSAREQFRAALLASDRLASLTGQTNKALTRRDFLSQCEEILRYEALPEARDEVGHVRVLAAESARDVTAPYLFLAGLSEQAFPQAGRDDCIHGEAETRRLMAAGLPLVPQSERSRHEMFLFYEVVTRAARRLTLSYPALDSAAQPLSPSPYLSAIEQAFAQQSLRRHEAPDLSCVPASDEVFCARDLRVRAIAQALDGKPALLGQLQHPQIAKTGAQQLLAGLQASTARRRGESFGAWEGMLVSQAARQVLTERYGTQHVWSPSQLEQYAGCPFRFFLDKVLRVEPRDEPALEADFRGRGQVVHALLSALHRGLNDRARAPASPGEHSETELQAEIDDLVKELLNARQSDRALGSGLLEIDLRRVTKWLAGYYQQHKKYDAQSRESSGMLRPAHFEVSFGPRRHRSRRPESDEEQGSDDQAEAVDALSSPEPFELDCGGETIRFSGRIDRIDLGIVAGQPVFGIIDYKSGSPARTDAKAVAEGYALQLPLYALAAERLLADQGAVPLAAAYWYVAGSGYKESIRFHVEVDGQLRLSPQGERLGEELRARVRSLVSGARQGQFPMYSSDEKCTSHCPYNTVCRVNQARALAKHWQAPREEQP